MVSQSIESRNAFFHTHNSHILAGFNRPQICRSGVRKYLASMFPVFTWLARYDLGRDLVGDLIAGGTVAVMHIPQGERMSTISMLSIINNYMFDNKQQTNTHSIQKESQLSLLISENNVIPAAIAVHTRPVNYYFLFDFFEHVHDLVDQY